MSTLNPFRKHLASKKTTEHARMTGDLPAVSFSRSETPEDVENPSALTVAPPQEPSRNLEHKPPTSNPSVTYPDGSSTSSPDLARTSSNYTTDASLPNPFFHALANASGGSQSEMSRVPSHLMEFGSGELDASRLDEDGSRHSRDTVETKRLTSTEEVSIVERPVSMADPMFDTRSAPPSTANVAPSGPLALQSTATEPSTPSVATPLETHVRESDTPRDSLDGGSDARTYALDGQSGLTSAGASPSLSRSSSKRVRPPPPKPRMRSSGKLSGSPVSAVSSDPARSANRTSPRALERPPLPPPPPPVMSLSSSIPPVRRPSEQTKKIPPPPPVSRRQSTRARPVSFVQEPRTSQRPPPPPPPPVRRAKSTSYRNSWSPAAAENNLTSVTTAPSPIQYPVYTCADNSSTPRSVPENCWSVPAEQEEPSAEDILLNLDKLQREVEELRGKFSVGT